MLVCVPLDLVAEFEHLVFLAEYVLGVDQDVVVAERYGATVANMAGSLVVPPASAASSSQ